MTLSEQLRRRLPPTAAVAVVLVAIGVTLLAGFALKSQCLQPWDTGVHQSSGCYNDLQELYERRGTAAGIFPYVEGDIVDGQLVDGSFEYPVLTGLFTWLPGQLSDSRDSYFVWSMILLAPFGVYTAWRLARLSGYRALFFAASPVMVWYGFLNWDLLVLAATAAAIWAWHRDKPLWSAFWLGVGACTKLYPGVFLLPLTIDTWRRRGFGTAFETACMGIATVGFINLPFVLINKDGWLATFEFQRLREADVSTNTIWYWGFPDISREDLNVLTPVLMAVCWAIAVGVGLWRMRREGRFPMLQVCAAMLATFMLWNKVHSPQYGLWIAMFFPLVNLRWGWWAAYTAFDTLMFWGIFRWFYDLTHRGVDFGPAKQMVVLGVWGRAAMLVLLFVMFLRAAPVPAPPPDEPPSVDPLGGGEGEREHDHERSRDAEVERVHPASA